MSPLIEGEKTFQDNEELNINQWTKLLGVSHDTVCSAYFRSGGKVKRGDPKHPNQPKQRLIPAGDFPKIVKGFQKTPKREDGHRYHEWSSGVDTDSDEFTITPKSGRKLTFTRQK